MVIDASLQFACQHEFVEADGVFTCHKCDRKTSELYVPSGRQSLLFFPVVVEQVLVPEELAG